METLKQWALSLAGLAALLGIGIDGAVRRGKQERISCP